MSHQVLTQNRPHYRIGIDLDGVCYPFVDVLRQWMTDRPDSVIINRAEGALDPEKFTEPTRWEFYKDWGMTTPEFLRICSDATDSGYMFTVGDPMPGVYDALRMLANAGHTLHAITDRTFGSPGVAAGSTIAWTARHGLPFSTFTFGADKAVAAGVDLMVDDKPENIHAMREAGVEARLVTAKWNRRFDTLGRADRVNDLMDFALRVLDGRIAPAMAVA